MNARKSLIAAVVLAAFGMTAATALAQGPGRGADGTPRADCPLHENCPAYGLGSGAGRGGMQPENVTARLADMKAALALQPDQLAAWDAYAARVQAQAEARAKLREGMYALRGDRQAMSDYRVTMLKQNAEAAEQINTLRKELTATLTAEQRATFDHFRMGPAVGDGRFGERGPRASGCGRA